MNSSDPLTVARIAANHTCVMQNIKVNVDMCAEGNFCID